MRRAAVAGLLLTLLAAGPATAQQASFDLIIRNGRVLDGNGNPWIRGDIGIRGDAIAAIGDLSKATARRVIDAQDRYVTPGFIDVHSHAGPGLEDRELGAGLPLLAQGITTVVVNPDGGGPTDLAGQRKRLTTHGIGVNVALMVPHGSIRLKVLGMADVAPNAAELAEMRTLVRQGMEAGAFGLSSGPYYAPGSYAKTDELVALATIAAEHRGVYSSHIRDESDYSVGVLGAIEEVIQIAETAKLPGIVTHIKALGPNVWGFSMAAINRIEQARARGVEVFADQYPWDASSTGLSAALVPRWAQVGGDSAMRRRFDDPKDRERLRAEMRVNLARRGGADRLMMSRHQADPSLEGKTLQQIATARGTDAVETAIAILKAGGSGVVSFNMIEDDIAAFMKQPWTITSSDGGLVRMGEGVPHPRAYGTFPRKLRLYVKERKVLSLEEAVRSMTSLPAAVFRMSDRGQIRVGAKADLAIFDLDAVRELATYQQPHQISEGMSYVVVNGAVAFENGRTTATRPGQVLNRH